MPRGQVAIGDRDEAREARLGREQVVAARVETALLDPIPDREQFSLRIEQEVEAHRSGDGPRRRSQRAEAALASVTAARRGRVQVPQVALDRSERRLGPRGRLGAGLVRSRASQGCRAGDDRRRARLEHPQALDQFRRSRGPVIATARRPRRALHRVARPGRRPSTRAATRGRPRCRRTPVARSPAGRSFRHRQSPA